MIDWCTAIPDTIRGVYIGDPCCKNHDLTLSTSRFYVCLYKKFRTKLSKSESKLWATIITTGGAGGCWVRCPIKMFRRL